MSVTGLYVHGRRLLNRAGQVVRLVGVNRGAAGACIQGWGIFIGPTDASTVRAMTNWEIYTVRIPLNEDCWLGINQGNDPAQYFGSNYRRAILKDVGEFRRYHQWRDTAVGCSNYPLVYDYDGTPNNG